MVQTRVGFVLGIQPRVQAVGSLLPAAFDPQHGTYGGERKNSDASAGCIQFDSDGGGQIEFSAVRIGLQCRCGKAGVHLTCTAATKIPVVRTVMPTEEDGTTRSEIHYHPFDDVPATAQGVSNRRGLLAQPLV